MFNPTWSTTPVLQMGHEGTSVAGVAGIYSPPVNDPDVVYVSAASSNAGGLWRSTNSGASSTWSLMRTGPIRKVIMNPGVILNTDDVRKRSDYPVILTSTGQILYSADGGNSWADGTGNIPSTTPINDIVGTSNGISGWVYVGTGGGVYSIRSPQGNPSLTSPNDGVGNQPLSVTLQWQAVQGATSYNVMVATNSNFQNIVARSTIHPTTSYSLGNLQPNTVYYWRVAATNVAGESSWPTARSFTTGPPPPPPPAPQNLTVTSVTGCGDSYYHPKLTWQAASGSIQSYLVYQQDCDETGECGFGRLIAEVNASTTTYTDCNIAIGNKFSTCTARYWVKSKDPYGQVSIDESNIVSVFVKFCNTYRTDLRSNGTETGLEPLPSDYGLLQNHPNPFNPITTITYALPHDGHVVLTVVNVLGTEVERLVDQFETAGYKSVSFDASVLPSGVYFYRLSAGSFTDVKKMVLAR